MLYDIVNFNADASCLSSEAWIGALQGNTHSLLCQWLNLYVELEKPVCIGFTGATLADVAHINPDAIVTLKNHPEIFQILWRPFAHDIALFRTEAGFRKNVELGRAVAEHLVGRVSEFYLPPEFMQTNRQTTLLAQAGVGASMILASRFGSEVEKEIPSTPYIIGGIFDGVIGCIPMDGRLTTAYLKTIQLLEAKLWRDAINGRNTPHRLWRDGESSFLLPAGLERERFWLGSCHEPRSHLGPSDAINTETAPATYPAHPFSAWMGEMRMMWYLQRLRELELAVFSDPAPERIVKWLQCIGSDILSAVEKLSPVIRLRTGDDVHDYRIRRCGRGYEGECLLEIAEKNQPIGIGPGRTEFAWQKKAAGRERVLLELL